MRRAIGHDLFLVFLELFSADATLIGMKRVRDDAKRVVLLLELRFEGARSLSGRDKSYNEHVANDSHAPSSDAGLVTVTLKVMSQVSANGSCERLLVACSLSEPG